MNNAELQPAIINVKLNDKAALYEAYMPFITNGGLFVRTEQPYKLGDEIFVVVQLVEANEKLAIAGKVVWITPKGAPGKRAQGVGVQFSEKDNGSSQTKIESILAGNLSSDRRTQTL